ncbi:MAG: hypothetical protein J6Y95_03410 [Lachnospiraceae bacterium]|nr:hypothetical protein [Lachnospiraceae bacterium]
MIEILHELWVQLLTCLVMAGVIVLAVFLGHKFREFMDKKKALKAGSEADKTTE